MNARILTVILVMISGLVAQERKAPVQDLTTFKNQVGPDWEFRPQKRQRLRRKSVRPMPPIENMLPIQRPPELPPYSDWRLWLVANYIPTCAGMALAAMLLYLL